MQEREREREREEAPQFRLIYTVKVDGVNYEFKLPISEKGLEIGCLRIRRPNRLYCFVEPIGSNPIPIEVDITRENAKGKSETEAVRPSLSQGVAIEHEGQETEAKIYIVKNSEERTFVAKVIYRFKI